MNTIPEFFGSLVFDDRVMKSRLPSGVYNSLRKTIAEGASLDSYVAERRGRRDEGWAVEHGATHFTHWFQPLTGITGRKARQLQSPPLGTAA